MNNHQIEQEQLNYLYSLDEDSFREPGVLDAVRALLESDNDDIREIVLLRLGCRARDFSIFERCLEILRKDNEADLVFSSAVSALVCLANDATSRQTVLDEIELALVGRANEKRKLVLRQAKTDLSKVKWSTK